MQVIRHGAWTALLVLAGAGQAERARAEDQAHRLDRMQTRALNLRAAAQHDLGEARPVPADPAEQALRRKEEEALARWRHAADCEAAGTDHRC